MKVKLLKAQRILHNAGEIVEVSPAVYDFLVTNKAAEPVKAEQVKRKSSKKGEK